ncbi:MAG: hypothetical protein Ct9H300mP8_02050 [Gammaproteobacteria bacterium]|nr:MAG: hypothetical protein Ct9H300mP8_02050 [Gammaproteobacteria bacterium]
MDEFAIGSVKKALAAMDSGTLAEEITPMEAGHEDEQPRRSKIDRIPTLRPAFKKDGTITAANAVPFRTARRHSSSPMNR